jgi:mannan endo-1,4-beta-mannosidase
MKKNMILFYILLSLICVSCNKENKFIIVKGNQFYKNGKPYHYIGANYWYGAMLGSKKADRERLIKELDELKSYGITNLRVLVGADGGDQDFTVHPALQPKQGEYDMELLYGLDFFLSELAKRDMVAILYLTNNWEWSGGMSKYLEWNGYGTVPNPNLEGNSWNEFLKYTEKFHQCEPCKNAFKNHVKFIMNRKNSLTHIMYTEDPTIMAWQVANEPRIFSKENEIAYTNWLNEVVDLIDSIDSNHLISTGSEGKAGSNDDLTAFERTHKNPKIDYLTMHIWPKNWGWFNFNDKNTSLERAIEKSIIYIDEHIQIAKKQNKPIVLEEFGFPKDEESLSRNASTHFRDIYYKSIFDRLVKSITNKENFIGLNFWGYGGFGKNNPENGKWQKGNDFTADPPQEPQGLNSIFSGETKILNLIKEYNTKINL